MRRLPSLAVLVYVLSVPSILYAQASIVGVVKDTSGAVLPGVTVEASSPALIEKTRSVITDGTGQYQIVNLPPGTYAVTYALTGFNTVKREGIVLSGTFTATVNSELRVGALEETVTVSGETPIVDVQGTTKQRVLGREVLDTIPADRSTAGMGVLIPGVYTRATQDVGGSSQNNLGSVELFVHGSRHGEQSQLQNGVDVANIADAAWFSALALNPVAVQEIAMDTAAVNVEYAGGGVRLNVITREGGNTFKTSVFSSFANHAMASNNFTEDLRNRGLKTPNSIKTLWDINPGLGGPLRKDRVWFYLSGRYNGTNNYAGGIFPNLNAGSPNAWTYAPDTSRQAENDDVTKDWALRLMWQANPKNKVGLIYHEAKLCGCPFGFSATDAAGLNRKFPVQRQLQADWTSPITSRLLFEMAGVYLKVNSVQYPVDGQDPSLVSVTDQSTGLTYRSEAQYRERPSASRHYRAALSYITGSHAVKVGMHDTNGWITTRIFSNQPVTYRFNNGVPNQLTELAFPFIFTVNLDHSLGVYAQDKWTTGRLTALGGVRYDYFSNSFPAQTLGPTPLLPTRSVTFPAQANLSLNDLTPRFGASYDLFGNGKTAIKASLNKYLQSIGTIDLAAMPNPVANTVNSTTRAWNDANRNFAPDCDLLNPAVNGECGPLANSAFGTALPGARFDPNVLTGWGKRGFNWEFSAGVQQQVVPRVAVDVSYFRRWYGNGLVTDNQATPASDFTQFSMTAPLDSRLPGGGGYVVSGLYNLNPNRFGVPAQNYVTFADHYGGIIDHFNGVDVNVNVRTLARVLLQGGFSTGRRTTDECDVASKLPLWLTTGAGSSTNSLVQGTAFTTVGAGYNLDVTDPAGVMTPAQFCHQDSGFLTQVKLLGSYTLPKADVQLSATFQSVLGPQIAAYYVATSAAVAPSLGRNLSGNAANVTVNLVAPGSMRGERLNQIDLRVAKILRSAKTRTSVNFDVYNALNNSAVLTLNNNYGAWQQPNSILIARFAKIGVQFDF